MSTFFIYYFIIPLLNSLNTIFLKSRAEKKRLHFYGTEGVITKIVVFHIKKWFFDLKIPFGQSCHHFYLMPQHKFNNQNKKWGTGMGNHNKNEEQRESSWMKKDDFASLLQTIQEIYYNILLKTFIHIVFKCSKQHYRELDIKTAQQNAI